MNITLDFNTEQLAALDDLVGDYNTASGSALTREQYLQTLLTDTVNARVAHNFATTANQLVDAAKAAPYEKRLELIATVQAKLAE